MEYNKDPNNILPLITEGKPLILRRSPIKRVELPKEGGIKTWIWGYDVPFWGYRNREQSKVVEIVKRNLRLMVDMFFHSIKKNPLKIVFFKKRVKKFIDRWLLFAAWAFRSYKYKPRLYSRPVRELYRVFNILIKRENNVKMKDRWRRARDVVCMILEVDQAYRYRAQDILSELNTEELKMSDDDKFYAYGGYSSFNKKPPKPNK